MKANTEGKEILPIGTTNEEFQTMETADKEFDIFEDFFGTIEDIMPDLGGKELAALLSLPEEQFKIFSEMFLDELDKSLNNPNDKLTLAQSLNISGVKVEDLSETFDSVLATIDNELKGKISKTKAEFLQRMFSTVLNAIKDSEGVSKRIIDIPIQLCREGAGVPQYAKAGDAGMDIYATEDIDILPGETKIIPTGLKVAIPRGYALLIQPRSGQSAKSKLRVANTPGLIDPLYRDELGVIVENIDPPIKDIGYKFKDDGSIEIESILHGSPIHIEKGQRFAQMRLVEVPSAKFYTVDNILDFEGNRNSGFGGTGMF